MTIQVCDLLNLLCIPACLCRYTYEYMQTLFIILFLYRQVTTATMCHYRNVHFYTTILSRAITNICWFYISWYTFQINSKTKCIAIWTSYDHKHPCHSTAKGLFSRDVRCRKRPRSESPAKGEAEKAMKRQLENNKNWMKIWINSIPFPEKLDQIDIQFYPILSDSTETRCCCRGLWPIDGVVRLPGFSTMGPSAGCETEVCGAVKLVV